MVMSFKRALALALLALGTLAACGPIYETQYFYTPPEAETALVCTNQCRQIGLLCQQNCDLRYDSCLAEARADAARDYDYYVRRREAEGKSIDRTLRDFDYSYRCTSSSGCKNACVNEFNVCYQTCGGAVTAQQVCVAFCN